MDNAEIIVAGAGPIGVTAAIELRRRGVPCRIVDPLPQPPQYAKAVGIQPRAPLVCWTAMTPSAGPSAKRWSAEPCAVPARASARIRRIRTL
ncbi:FAD-dependent monooxygenase [Nocardia sp. CA-129566]|uniref:FAD-dependent monooxygenase n=1 Tax=Nocardia sp. CA-129566 TaxID=3239976 RepID=UPI003D972ACF